MRLTWLPNLISCLRILLVSVFVASFFYVDTALPLTLALIIIASDVVDGFFARAFHVESKLGSMLDSIADTLFVFSSFFLFSLLPLLLGFDFLVITLLPRFLMLVLFVLFALSKKPWTPRHFLGNKIAGASHYAAIVYLLLAISNYLPSFSYSFVLLLIAIHYIGMLLAFVEFTRAQHNRI